MAKGNATAGFKALLITWGQLCSNLGSGPAQGFPLSSGINVSLPIPPSVLCLVMLGLGLCKLCLISQLSSYWASANGA